MKQNSDDWPALLDARRRLGLTQAAMAHLMDTPMVTYKSWETGRYRPPGVAIAFCRLYLLQASRPAVIRQQRLDYDQIVALYTEGKPVAEIANLLRCSRTAIYKILQQRGVARRSKNQLKLSPESVLARYKSGERASAIAASAGVATVTIYKHLRRAGDRHRIRRAMRPTRESIAIDEIDDIHGSRWLVTEWRPTDHGFRIALGWPDGGVRGGVAVIQTAELVEYLTATTRPRDINLPIAHTTVKRLRTELDLFFDWDVWWDARRTDLLAMTLEQFCARHHCSMGAASQRRATMRR